MSDPANTIATLYIRYQSGSGEITGLTARTIPTLC